MRAASRLGPLVRATPRGLVSQNARSLGQACLYTCRMESIGARIRAARESSGKTQLACATEVGVYAWSWCQWEAGRTKPRGERLDAIARATGVSLVWLIRGTGEMRPAEPSSAA